MVENMLGQFLKGIGPWDELIFPSVEFYCLSDDAGFERFFFFSLLFGSEVRTSEYYIVHVYQRYCLFGGRFDDLKLV